MAKTTMKAFEKSKTDKKAGVPVKKWEGSKADRKADKSALAKINKRK